MASIDDSIRRRSRRLRQCATKAVLYLNNVEEDENGIVLPHICLVDESSSPVSTTHSRTEQAFEERLRVPDPGPSLPFPRLSVISPVHVPHFCPAARDVLSFVSGHDTPQRQRAIFFTEDPDHPREGAEGC